MNRGQLIGLWLSIGAALIWGYASCGRLHEKKSALSDERAIENHVAAHQYTSAQKASVDKLARERLGGNASGPDSSALSAFRSRWAYDELLDSRILPARLGERSRRAFLVRPKLWEGTLCVIESELEPETPDQAPVILTESYAADEVLAVSQDPETLRTLLNAQDYRTLFEDKVYLFKLPEATLDAVPDAIRRAGAHGQSGLSTNAVHFAMEADPYRAIPNDPYFRGQWHHSLVESALGWNLVDWDKAAQSVVGVLDCGVNYTHADLRDNALEGFCAVNVNKAEGAADFVGHGSACAGIIGATGNNAAGVCGMAWRVKVFPLKALRRFMRPDGSYTAAGYSSDILECYAFAASLKSSTDPKYPKIHVLNCSFGRVGGYSSAEYTALDELRKAGIAVVTAAGNESIDIDKNPVYPACYDLDNIVTVASVSSRDTLSLFSNRGASTVDIAAPGEGIETLSNSGNFYNFSFDGTSAAAPVVAGTLALVRSRFQGDYKSWISKVLNQADKVSALERRVRKSLRLNVAGALGVDRDAIPPPSADSFTTPDTPSRDRIELSWTPNPNLYYRIYRSGGYGLAREAVSGWIKGSAFSDYNVNRGESYYYWLRSAADVYGANASGFSRVPVVGLANYPDERYLKGTLGTLSALEKLQLRLPRIEGFYFSKRPTVTGIGYSLDQRKQKVVLNLGSGWKPDTLIVQYRSNAFKLYRPTDLNKRFYALGKPLDSFIEANGQLPALSVPLSARIKLDTGWKTVEAGYTLRLLPPQVDTLWSSDTFPAGGQIYARVSSDTVLTIQGRFFGWKKPKVYLEYRKIPGGKIFRYPLKVISKPLYPDRDGREKRSFMELSNGESLIQVRLPAKWPRWAAEGGFFSLVIDSRSGLGTCAFHLDVPKIPSGT